MPGNEHVFLCGETARGASLDARTHALTLHGLNPSVSLRIEDISGPMVADIPEMLLDLLEVAAFVYAADARLSRGGAKDAEWGKRWRRAFRLTIPVRNPTLWTDVRVLRPLTETLSMLSDDTYTFDFQRLTERPERQAYFTLADTTGRPRADRVQLFSGGLDSFAGAAEQLAESETSLALVSHRSAPKLANAQLRLIQALQERFGSGRVFHIPVWTQLTRDGNRESTHRARSFLFAALAAVVARLFQKDDCAFYENGVTSLNLPISRQVVGGRATRSTHPIALKGFGEIFGALFGQAFIVQNPYADRTKTEIVEAVARSGMQDSIRDTRSCANVRSSTNQHPHCGECSQCVDRRLAMFAADAELHDPDAAYKVDLFADSRPEGPKRALVMGMIETARTMHREDDAALFHAFPELTRAIVADRASADAAAKRMIDLTRRHGASVVKALEKGVEVHKRSLAEGTLPGDCLLALLSGGGGSVSGPVIVDDELRLPAPTIAEVSFPARGRAKARVGEQTISGQGAELLVLLAEAFRQDQAEERPLERYRFLTAKEIADGLKWTSEEGVRQAVKRCRRRLRKGVGNEGALDDNAVIENVPRHGYRLNPRTVRIVRDVAET